MKFCIIGSRGHIGYVFDSIGEVPEVRLTAVASGSSDSPEVLVQMAEKAGYQPQIFVDWKRMIEEVKPELVAVDGPFDRHAEMTAYALERGIHVFCEKPIALTLSDLTRVEKAWKDGNAHLLSMVGLRYEPAFQAALNLVRAGAVGKVKMVRAQKSYRLGERPEFYRHLETYGGTIPWVGSHALDWIMAFSGGGFQKIWATQSATDNFGHGDLEIACQCMFLMDNGVQAQASLDYLRPGAAPTHGDDRVRIAGTSGVLEVRSECIYLIDAAGEREIAVPPPSRKIFSDFVESIQGKHPCWVRDDEAIELTRACLTTRDQAVTAF